MITSKLTRQGRSTIPQTVRTALGLRRGDTITYRITGDQAVMSRLEDDADQPSGDVFAVFCEWDSASDRAAYADL